MPTTPSSPTPSETEEKTPLHKRKSAKVDRLAELMGDRGDDGHGAGIWREAFGRMRRSHMAISGAIIVVVFLLVALLSPLIAPYSPTSQAWGSEEIGRVSCRERV